MSKAKMAVEIYELKTQLQDRDRLIAAQAERIQELKEALETCLVQGDWAPAMERLIQAELKD